MNRRTNHLATWTAIPLLFVGLILTGCDSSGSNGDSGPTRATISGQATTSAKASKASVEGATVTAVSVTSDGDTDELEGETTTNADGSFELDVEGTGARGIVIVTAEKASADFEQKAIVKVDGRSNVQSAVLTNETTAEANVYVQAENEDSDGEDGNDGDDSDGDSDTESGDTDEDANGEDEQGVTSADVVAHVDAELAAEINSGATSPQAVAKAIAGGILAEAEFFAQSQSSVAMETVEEEKEALFLQLQSDLNAAANAEERAAAKDAFEESYANVFVAVGVTAETQAKARQAATSTIMKRATALSAAAKAEVKQKAELFQAFATGAANEARFQAAGATQASITALQDAQAALVADIRASATASVTGINNAKATYESDVRTAIESGFSTTATTIATAEDAFATSLQTLLSALDTDPSNTANAYVTFYGSAETSAETAFSSAGVTNAEAAGDVLVLTTVGMN
ncbi:hypothetical protein CRI94_03870 [Longibacter salinarum]|uniref:Uncharacterized protein n=1 Tax=Longibacter salinarum TaxID=1850348 RepID=A0A2A8D0L1_9BACT|nr:hypothetical protein [Longibacter salinarum]PEN14188.1 hypothetical protein CRI94_03870 [Longibacter salinarum]